MIIKTSFSAQYRLVPFERWGGGCKWGKEVML